MKKRKKGLFVLKKVIKKFMITKTQLNKFNNEVTSEDLLNLIDKLKKD